MQLGPSFMQVLIDSPRHVWKHMEDLAATLFPSPVKNSIFLDVGWDAMFSRAGVFTGGNKKKSWKKEDKMWRFMEDASEAV